MISYLINFIKKIYLKASLVELKRKLDNKSGEFYLYGRVVIENTKNVTIGKNSTINEGVYISGHDVVTIGNDVSLSAGCKIITAYLDATQLQYKMDTNIHLSKPVSIGSFSQIGAGAIILPGVDIGSGVIVGAGAVVAQSFPSNVIIAGVPAKLIRVINNEA